ncbi:hypothetical protein [Streptomyces sp. NPDC059215]|uniref:hypothetical protein n=1 Tax=Streptomyces sp. NPDC059215 TaxID=3346772 RepID=UPI0036BAE321
MHTGRPPMIPSTAAAGLSGTALALAGAPWWLTAAALGCCIAGLIVVVIQSVFPQDSEHRLAWWRDRRSHQQVRRQQPARTRRRSSARTPEARTTHTEPPGHDG